MQESAATPRGPRCLVIGAASGIGRAVVERMGPGAAVMVAADLPGAPRHGADAEVAHVDLDVTDPASVEAGVAKALAETGGRLDVVVNTAGIVGEVRPAAEETLESFERMLQVNLTGAFLVSRAVLPHLARSGSGRLIHFASTAGKEGVAGMAAYSTSKAGIMGLVKALAKEYASSGVTVNAIAPGKVATPLLRDMAVTEADLARIPMGRLGTASEAAALVEYIASPDASYTTGFVYDLSGGRATY